MSLLFNFISENTNRMVSELLELLLQKLNKWTCTQITISLTVLLVKSEAFAIHPQH